MSPFSLERNVLSEDTTKSKEEEEEVLIHSLKKRCKNDTSSCDKSFLLSVLRASLAHRLAASVNDLTAEQRRRRKKVVRGEEENEEEKMSDGLVRGQ